MPTATRVWQKWRFSVPQTHLWLIEHWFSASTFVVKTPPSPRRKPLPAGVKTYTTIIKLDWQTSNYFRKFLKVGTLTKRDLLAYYSGEDVKDKFRLIEKEINDL